MSYVMQIVGEGEPFSDAGIRRALDRISRASRARCRAKTAAAHADAKAAMREALIELYEANPNEFELLAGNMTHALATMVRFSMLDEETQHDRFPDYREFGITDEMIRDAAGEDGRDSRELELYHAARDAVLDKQVENPTGIPLYKLRTNDGWLVTPDEITAALGALRTIFAFEGVEEPDYFWWPYWVAFLERAGKHGGFRVH